MRLDLELKTGSESELLQKLKQSHETCSQFRRKLKVTLEENLKLQESEKKMQDEIKQL